MSDTIGSLSLARGLPSNIEAEQFVLGTVLLADQTWPEVASRLRASDFMLEKHRRIFRCMSTLAERSEKIEYLTLVDELEKRVWLESIDGIAYIASLTDGLPRLASIVSYIRIVKDKATLRELIFISQNAVAYAMDPMGDETAEVVASAQASLDVIRQSHTTGGLIVNKEAIEASGGLEKLLDPTQIMGIKTPFIEFDDRTGGLHRGDLVIIAGRPSMGKTTLALNMASYIAFEGYRVGFFSLEMGRGSLLQRMTCSHARVDFHRFRGNWLNAEEKRRLDLAGQKISAMPMAIDDQSSVNAMDIRSRAMQMRSASGLDLIFIDYLQLIDTPEVKTASSRAEQVSRITRQMKVMAKDLDIPVVLLSQLNRAAETRPGDHRPILSDLRESGSIEQDADLVAFVFREEVYKPDREDLHGTAEILIAKQRNGPIGRIKLAFLHRYVKFENLLT